MVAAHSIEVPSLTKHIENCIKTVCGFRPANWTMLAHAALAYQVTSNDSFVINKLVHVELRFDCIALRLKRRISRELRFIWTYL